MADETMTSSVSVIPGPVVGPIDPSVIGRNDVVILPRRRTPDGKGIYGEATLFLGKELRESGLGATYVDEPPDRVFEVKKSALVRFVP